MVILLLVYTRSSLGRASFHSFLLPPSSLLIRPFQVNKTFQICSFAVTMDGR